MRSPCNVSFSCSLLGTIHGNSRSGLTHSPHVIIHFHGLRERCGHPSSFRAITNGLGSIRHVQNRYLRPRLHCRQGTGHREPASRTPPIRLEQVVRGAGRWPASMSIRPAASPRTGLSFSDCSVMPPSADSTSFCSGHSTGSVARASSRRSSISNALRSTGFRGGLSRKNFSGASGPFADAVLAIIACIAKQERIRLSERVKAGLERARSQGKVVGRPKIVVNRDKVMELQQEGLSQWEISQKLGVSRASVGRIIAEGKAS